MRWNNKADNSRPGNEVADTIGRRVQSTIRRVYVGLSVLLLACNSAQAALISRFSGQAYYDDVLNITWVADANLAQTMGYDTDGFMTWNNAQAWIASLNSANYLGFSDWRLPSPDVGADNTIVDCATASELTCRDNEMGYMWWQNLVTSDSPSPFSNVVPGVYWSSLEYASDSGRAWYFNFEFPDGNQGTAEKNQPLASWAVRSGDSTVIPIPSAVALLGSALGLLGLARKSLASKVRRM